MNAIPKASPDALPELDTSLKTFIPLFRRATSRKSVERYVTGLLNRIIIIFYLKSYYCHYKISRNSFSVSSAQGHMLDVSLPALDPTPLNQLADSSGASGQSHATSTLLQPLPTMELSPFHEKSRWMPHSLLWGGKRAARRAV
jgi:hypothetical protein